MRFFMLFGILLLALAVVPAARAQPTGVCLPNQPPGTVCLDERFAAYWRSNGGLPVFGYAIADARPERIGDSPQEFLAQWTERNRLELHPENPAPYTILLGRMGAERLAQLGRDPNGTAPEAGPQPGCRWFPETGHNVCNQDGSAGFLSYWQSHGLQLPGLGAYQRSLALFGLPLTSAQPEQTASGETLITQWFERARFEWHPANPNPYRVLLGRLGAELRSEAGAAPAAPATSLFGVSIGPSQVAATAGRAAELRATWVRYNGVRWSDVETSPGAREWARIALQESELQVLSAQGLTPVVVVRSTPDWAQLVPGHSCGPIKPEALDAFAGFMRDLVARYSAPPYNVRYWELWNEPDVDPALIGPDAEFGCWGDPSGPYYGGERYAEMLKRVYPAIKAANPTAQVLIGGLLLDCDAEHPLPGRNCAESRFLEGVLRNGGAAAFDIMSYHGYAYWIPRQVDWDVSTPNWQARGGVMLGKLQFVRATLAAYGVDKPILLTEAGLLCYRDSPICGDDFRTAQADYAVRLYARTLANGLLGAVWYMLPGPGWQGGGLLDANGQPRPAYQAMRFMADLLRGASYAGPRSADAVEGYAFQRGAARYEIYWTNDDRVVSLPVPAGARAVYAASGQPMPIDGPTLQVNPHPVIVEVAGP